MISIYTYIYIYMHILLYIINPFLNKKTIYDTDSMTPLSLWFYLPVHTYPPEQNQQMFMFTQKKSISPNFIIIQSTQSKSRCSYCPRIKTIQPKESWPTTAQTKNEQQRNLKALFAKDKGKEHNPDSQIESNMKNKRTNKA